MLDHARRLVQERFGDTAQNYVTSAIHSSGYTLDKLVELVQPGQGKRALDIATGGGHVALGLSRAGAWTFAYDLTMPMLRAARDNIGGQTLHAEYISGDAQHLPFPAHSFDIVTARLAPHHFPDVTEFVAECVRLLRPGGVFGLVDHAGAPESAVNRYVNVFEQVRDPSHVWEYSQAEWEAICTEQGLRITYSETVRTRLNFNWWTKMQNNNADTMIRLRVLLNQAPQAVKNWLEPADMDNDACAFTRWQLILMGVKPE